MRCKDHHAVAQAHSFMGESPLLEGGKVKWIKSTHFSPSSFKCSLHTHKASINSFGVRCQQSIILSIIKIKMPVSAPETKNKLGRIGAWQESLPFLLGYP